MAELRDVRLLRLIGRFGGSSAVNVSLVQFYAFIFVATVMDVATEVVLLWHSLSVSDNEFEFGLVFLISILVPYFIRRSLASRSPGRGQWSGLRGLMVGRAVVFAALAAFSICAPTMNLLMIGSLFFCISCANYVTTEAVEGMNIKVSMFCGIPPLTVARWMQATVQVAVFAGNLVGGISLKLWGFEIALVGLLLCSALASAPLVSLQFRRFCESVECEPEKPTGGKAPRSRSARARLPDGAIILIFMLASIGLHVSLYNFMGPILFQKLRDWSSADYGICSALGGIGALSATFFKVKSPRFALLALGLLVGDAAFVTAPFRWIAFAAALLIGFSLNSARIGIRARLTELAPDRQGADHIARDSAFAYFMLQATGPLFAAILGYFEAIPARFQPGVLLLAPVLLGIGVWIFDRPRILARNGRRDN